MANNRVDSTSRPRWRESGLKMRSANLLKNSIYFFAFLFGPGLILVPFGVPIVPCLVLGALGAFWFVVSLVLFPLLRQLREEITRD